MKKIISMLFLLFSISIISFDSYAYGDISILDVLPIDSPIRTTHKYNVIATRNPVNPNSYIIIGTKSHINLYIENGEIRCHSNTGFKQGDIVKYQLGTLGEYVSISSYLMYFIPSQQITYHSDLIKDKNNNVVYPLNYVDPYEGYDSFIKTTDLNPLLTYTNNTDYPITIELFSDGQSNVTISSPTKWAGTNDIGISKIPFELLPLEKFTVFKNSGDPINIGIKPQSEYAPIELPNEYLYITSPPEGKQTTDKWMTYNIMYSIQASKIDDVQINIRDINGSSFTQNPQIKTFESLNHNAMVVNGYARGSLQVFVDYNSSFTGSIGTKVKIINTVTKKELSLTRNAEILPFIDSNSDGYDDVTGEDLYIRPVIPSMDDLSITDSVAALANIIPSLTSFIGSIVGLIGIVFGWLPAPVISLMAFIMLIIGITTLLKVLRG